MAVSLLVPTAIIIYLIRNAVAPDDPPSVTNSIGPRAKPSLQLVIVVTRHGKRGPMITYPTCPYPIDDTKAWPYGVAQLTKALYIDGDSASLEPSDFNIPGCDFPCAFNLLKNITEKYYNITDFVEECQLNYTDSYL
uniref:Lysosomal acid phosphatase n=1 Tax=Graphocephala atropunctata TaxID=36148 RepID=A0A1B6LMB6_9HEMI